MTQSDITDSRMQAVFLKPHLKLLSVGMKNSRFTNRQLLDKATQLTGIHYKRGQYDVAIADLQVMITGAEVQSPTT